MRRLGLAVMLSASVATSACVQTRQIADLQFTPPQGDFKLLVMRPDVVVNSVTTGGLPEPILVVPVPGLNKAVARTIRYARALSKNVTALHVTDDLDDAALVRKRWKEWGTDVPLVIVESKYRALMGPLLHYLDAVSRQNPSAPITVVLAEYVPHRWWEWPLHNQTALRLKGALLGRPAIVVISVPYHLDKPAVPVLAS